MRARSSAAWIAVLPSCGAATAASSPWKEPIGVLAAATITTFLIISIVARPGKIRCAFAGIACRAAFLDSVRGATTLSYMWPLGRLHSPLLVSLMLAALILAGCGHTPPPVH